MTVSIPSIVTTDREVILHLISDAGSLACLFARQVVKLLMAETKVFPVTKNTMPKVELTALLLSYCQSN